MNEHNTTRRFPQYVRGFLFLVVAALLAMPVLAQESDENVNRIEIRDGKVYVNDEMVKELENADARVVFSRNGDRDIVFLGDDNLFGNVRLRSPQFNQWMDGEGAVGFFSDDDNLTVFNRDANHAFGSALELYRERATDPFVAAFGQTEEIRRLERRSQEIARQLRTSDEGDRAELDEELLDVLGQIFDLKLAEQQKRVDRMSGELDELRARIQDRRSARREIIERRQAQLKGERDRLDW